MAHIKNNPIMHGASGMLGDVVVFRQVGGKTVMANRPRKPRFQSQRQKEHRLRFKQAAAFARSAILDQQKKEYYKAMAPKLKVTNAYTAALTMHMRTGGRPEPEKAQTYPRVPKQLAVASRTGRVPISFAEQFRQNFNAVAGMLVAMVCFWIRGRLKLWSYGNASFAVQAQSRKGEAGWSRQIPVLCATLFYCNLRYTTRYRNA